MEFFEQIRKEKKFGVGTIRGVAHKLGVHGGCALGLGDRGTAAAQRRRTGTAGNRVAATLHRGYPGGRSQRVAQAANSGRLSADAMILSRIRVLDGSLPRIGPARLGLKYTNAESRTNGGR